MDSDVFIVLPAFNEARVIERVVHELRARYPNVVVVDDGSTDGTAAAARAAGARVLRHLVNRGQGAALQTAIEYCLLQGARYVVTFDSDGQHEVESVGRLLEPLRAGRAEVTLGSRFLGSTERLPVSRRLLLKAAVLFTRVVSGLPVTDTHNGLRAFTRRALDHVHITLDRMAHASELLDQVRDAGLPWLEVPVHVRYTPYSAGKGQPSSGMVRIVIDYALQRVMGWTPNGRFDGPRSGAGRRR